jgi:hypothetical protein
MSAATAANSARRNRASASWPLVTPSTRYPRVRSPSQISCSISRLSSTTNTAVPFACVSFTAHLVQRTP